MMALSVFIKRPQSSKYKCCVKPMPLLCAGTQSKHRLKAGNNKPACAVYISRLRKKLGRDVIIAVRGMAYRLGL